MSPQVLKLFRTIQVHFPFLQDYKFAVQRQWRCLVNKTHEEDFEILPLLATAKNVCVDIGANRGDAIQSILMRLPGAKVFAFEPNTFLHEKLKARYGNHDLVKLINCGLGSCDDSFELFIPFYNQYMFDGLASFKEANAREWLVNRIYNFDRNKLEIKKMLCQVRCLDDFQLKPDFIKIDVQGFEYEVLQGGAQTIKEHRPVVLMESPGEKELAFMSGLGYRSFYYKDKQLNAGKKYYNIFFLPSEKIGDIAQRIPMRFASPVAA